MKTYILLFALLVTVLCKAQDTDTIQSPVMKAYNDLMAYTPKTLKNIPAPENLKQWPMNNLSNIMLAYQFQSNFGLKPEDVAWLTERTNTIAIAFYLEGNALLLRSTGGYSGCPESEYELKKEKLKGKEVTVVNFCHGCKEDTTAVTEFITIFNNRTKRLLEGTK